MRGIATLRLYSTTAGTAGAQPTWREVADAGVCANVADRWGVADIHRKRVSDTHDTHI